jgi:sugar lactone lactonase YvrE
MFGSGFNGYRDGQYQNSNFSDVTGGVVSASGSIHVADSGNHRIRFCFPNGNVTTLAGNGTAGFADGSRSVAMFNEPSDVKVDSAGNAYVADLNNNRIRIVYPNGNVATLAGERCAGSKDGVGANATFNQPCGLAIDSSRNLYVVDRHSNVVRKVTPSGNVTTIAGSGFAGSADGVGRAASFNYTRAIAIDAAGNLYVADQNNNKIRLITPAGVVSTYAGNGIAGGTDGSRLNATFNKPSGVAVDEHGNVFVTEYEGHRVRVISNDGMVMTLAGNGQAGDTPGIGTESRLRNPDGISTSAGITYVFDRKNHKVRDVRIICPSTAHILNRKLWACVPA